MLSHLIILFYFRMTNNIFRAGLFQCLFVGDPTTRVKEGVNSRVMRQAVTVVDMVVFRVRRANI